MLHYGATLDAERVSLIKCETGKVVDDTSVDNYKLHNLTCSQRWLGGTNSHTLYKNTSTLLLLSSTKQAQSSLEV